VRSDWDLQSEDFEPHFGYSGTARTNNRGEFTFVTIFPGSYDMRAPHVYLSVHHREVGELVTQIFFAHHPRNAQDTVLTSFSVAEQESLMAKGEPVDEDYSLQGRRYRITLTLDGVNHYQRY
jgi:protocatechuate 3,4-dioxygenase beta subunit